MHRRHTPLELWERCALRAYARAKGYPGGKSLAATAELERIARQATFLLRSGLHPVRSVSVERTQAARACRKAISKATPRIEYRLAALFSE